MTLLAQHPGAQTQLLLAIMSHGCQYIYQSFKKELLWELTVAARIKASDVRKGGGGTTFRVSSAKAIRISAMYDIPQMTL